MAVVKDIENRLRQYMRSSSIILMTIVVTGLLAVGCAGPEKKLGRGLRNTLEITRMSEMRRSIEQTALWDGGDKAYTTGLIRGFNRTVARTALGVFEVVTFPIPTTPEADFEAPFTSDTPLYPDPSIATLNEGGYGGLVIPEDPVYPDVHKPGKRASSALESDTTIGFDGGEVAPFFPGSRFHVFQ